MCNKYLYVTSIYKCVKIQFTKQQTLEKISKIGQNLKEAESVL